MKKKRTATRRRSSKAPNSATMQPQRSAEARMTADVRPPNGQERRLIQESTVPSLKLCFSIMVGVSMHDGPDRLAVRVSLRSSSSSSRVSCGTKGRSKERCGAQHSFRSRASCNTLPTAPAKLFEDYGGAAGAPLWTCNTSVGVPWRDLVVQRPWAYVRATCAPDGRPKLLQPTLRKHRQVSKVPSCFPDQAAMSSRAEPWSPQSAQASTPDTVPLFKWPDENVSPIATNF